MSFTLETYTDATGKEGTYVVLKTVVRRNPHSDTSAEVRLAVRASEGTQENALEVLQALAQKKEKDINTLIHPSVQLAGPLTLLAEMPEYPEPCRTLGFASVGKYCQLGKYVLLAGHVTLGEYVVVGRDACIFDAAIHRKDDLFAAWGNVTIGDHCHIGERASLRASLGPESTVGADASVYRKAKANELFSRYEALELPAKTSIGKQSHVRFIDMLNQDGVTLTIGEEVYLRDLDAKGSLTVGDYCSLKNIATGNNVKIRDHVLMHTACNGCAVEGLPPTREKVNESSAATEQIRIGNDFEIPAYSILMPGWILTEEYVLFSNRESTVLAHPHGIVHIGQKSLPGVQAVAELITLLRKKVLHLEEAMDRTAHKHC